MSFKLPHPLPRPSRRALAAAAVAALVLTAFVLRLLPAPSGLPYLHDWDEPVLASTALNVLKTGDPDPRFLHYGSLTIYALVAVDVAHYLHLMRADPPAFPVTRGVFEHREIDLDVLETWFDHGWLWEVSHPSFYLWNRAFLAVLGALSVLLVFLLGRQLRGAATGFLAAGVLAVLGFHIEYSSVVNADLPRSLCALGAVYASVVFAARPRRRTLLLALVLAGLAASAKYNGVLTVLAPVTALAAVELGGGREIHRRWWWSVPLVPAAAFLATSPYVLLDLPTFLRQAGFEIHHYTVRGHAVVEAQPGWEQLAYQCRQVAEHLGTVASLVALAGIVLLLRDRRGRVALAFPVLYFLYMITTRMAFHRNVLEIYPFLALAAATAVVEACRRLRAEGRHGMARRAGTWILVLLVAAHLGSQLYAVAVDGWGRFHERESRSRAIDAVAELAGADARVGLAAELRFHPLDLARLGVPYEVRPHLELVCDPARYDVVVTGGSYLGVWPSNPEGKRQARELNSAPLDVERRDVGEGVTHVDGLSIHPKVRIYLTARRDEGRPEVCSSPVGEPGDELGEDDDQHEPQELDADEG